MCDEAHGYGVVMADCIIRQRPADGQYHLMSIVPPEVADVLAFDGGAKVVEFVGRAGDGGIEIRVDPGDLNAEKVSDAHAASGSAGPGE